jgi:non-homologous end joining protein Ku
MKLIEAKAKGQKVEAPPPEPEPMALDFMEALKRSLSPKGKTRHASRQHANKGRRRRAS